MATQNTGYQRATNLTVRRGNDARVYSLLDSFVGDAPYDNIKYGFLYNWYATQEQGTGVWLVGDDMRSEGWGSPSDTDFDTLATHLGGASVAGGKLKETGFTYWDSPNTGATNEVGFNGRGSGSRFANESGRIEGLPLVDFLGIKYVFTAISKNGLYEIFIVSDSDNIEINQTAINDLVKTMGYSIRLVRPATTAEQLLPDGELSGVFYYGNDGKKYRTTKIGTQVWIADNLAETKWSDGSWIQGYDGGTYTPITDANWAALTTAALCAYG
ncbi:MAG: FISUMP domain-containing protein, partial [Candidatus Bathyarchaeia archaeon]